MYRRVGRILFARPQERGGGAEEGKQRNAVYMEGGRKAGKREAPPSTKCFPLLRRNLPSKISFRSAEGGEGLERADGWKQGECACGGEREEEEGRRGGGGSE